MALNKSKWFRWIKIFIIIYCLVGIALYYLQEKMLFHPLALPQEYQYSFSFPSEEMAIPINKTDTISLVKFFPRDSVRRGLVLYFHGNRENINRYAGFAENFTRQGYEVWMPDYPGFGKSRGVLTEKSLYNLAFQVKRMAEARYEPGNILLYGKSLGTGIAAYIASNGHSRVLILETPYYSIPDLFGNYAPLYPTNAMSKFKLPTYEFLPAVKAPVVIFHGDDDGVIPYRSAAKLKKHLKPSDLFITIPGGKHNNLTQSPLYHQTLDSILHSNP